jgi:UDP-GlcNAc:undecaprenyl-phosphate GlcNAc-1-phosphate transferase
LEYAYPIASFILTICFTPLVRKLSVAIGWKSAPSVDRWNQNAIAVGGGIAIFFAVMLPAWWLTGSQPFLGGYLFQPETSDAGHRFIDVFLVGSFLVFILGLLDDWIHINPHSKLIGQIVLAALTVYAGFRIHWFDSLTIDTMVTLLWIVGVTNAFNLIDNMDGLCAGVGAICGLFMGVLLLHYQTLPSVLSFCVAASLVGFLVYNFKPASIFMGDCGSLLVGVLPLGPDPAIQ